MPGPKFHPGGLARKFFGERKMVSFPIRSWAMDVGMPVPWLLDGPFEKDADKEEASNQEEKQTFPG